MSFANSVSDVMKPALTGMTKPTSKPTQRKRASQGGLRWTSYFPFSTVQHTLWLLLSLVRLGLLCGLESGDRPTWLLQRIGCIAVQLTVVTISLLLDLMGLCRSSRAQWGSFIDALDLLFVTMFFLQYHPVLNPTPRAIFAAALEPFYLLLGVHQLLSVVLRSQLRRTLLVGTLVPFVISCWGLAEWLALFELPTTPCSRCDAAECAIALFSLGPAHGALILWVILNNDKSWFSKALGDKVFADGVLRLAMARFDAVLGLTNNFCVVTASPDADELLGAKVERAPFLELLEDGDAEELCLRLKQLGQDTDLTTSMTCQMKHRHDLQLRVWATALREPEESGKKDPHFVLGLDQAICPADAGPSHAIPLDEAARPRSGSSARRNRSTQGRATPPRAPPSLGTPPRGQARGHLEERRRRRPDRPRAATEDEGGRSSPIEPPEESVLSGMEGNWEVLGKGSPLSISGQDACIQSTVRLEVSDGRVRLAGGQLVLMSQDILLWHCPASSQPLMYRRMLVREPSNISSGESGSASSSDAEEYEPHPVISSELVGNQDVTPMASPNRWPSSRPAESLVNNDEEEGFRPVLPGAFFE